MYSKSLPCLTSSFFVNWIITCRKYASGKLLPFFCTAMFVEDIAVATPFMRLLILFAFIAFLKNYYLFSKLDSHYITVSWKYYRKTEKREGKMNWYLTPSSRMAGWSAGPNLTQSDSTDNEIKYVGDGLSKKLLIERTWLWGVTAPEIDSKQTVHVGCLCHLFRKAFLTNYTLMSLCPAWSWGFWDETLKTQLRAQAFFCNETSPKIGSVISCWSDHTFPAHQIHFQSSDRLQ